MKRHSTGALTKEQHARQDALYHEQHPYDFVIIGTGMSALSAGALLANAGYRICMLEAHDAPGGYAHTFAMGDFEFCAQVHYIWGCAPGQAIYQFLEHIGLHEEVSFQAFDPDGYDVAALPDGKRIAIPFGFGRLIDHLDDAYPGQRDNLCKFVATIEALRDEMRHTPHPIRWWHYLAAPVRFRNLIKYKDRTLQDLFNACQLRKEFQAVLCAAAGDFGSPPEELSLIAYVALFAGYNEGAYYPTHHFKNYVGRLAQFIADHDGCHIFYETEVTAIKVDGKSVASVETAEGKTFTAERYLCNMDPQKVAGMIGRERFPESYLPALSYHYSPSSFITYLGVKDIDLRDYGFGNFNIWHLEQWDMNTMWKEQMAGNFDKPWLFVSTPSLRTPDTSGVPKGCQTMEFGTLTSYEHFHRLQQSSPREYREAKRQLRDHFLDIIEEKYVPGIRKHIKLMVTGSPTTNESFCWAPFGNCYGSVMTPKNIGLARLTAETPWHNLFWCNASSGYAGIHGTTLTGINLYQDLTGDSVVDPTKRPSPDKAIHYACSKAHQPG